MEALKVTLEHPLALKIGLRGQNRPKPTMEYDQTSRIKMGVLLSCTLVLSHFSICLLAYLLRASLVQKSRSSQPLYLCPKLPVQHRQFAYAMQVPSMYY